LIDSWIQIFELLDLFPPKIKIALVLPATSSFAASCPLADAADRLLTDLQP
jgi:hypothetical protein